MNGGAPPYCKGAAASVNHCRMPSYCRNGKSFRQSPNTMPLSVTGEAELVAELARVQQKHLKSSDASAELWRVQLPNWK
jgi:hypothetical protein